MKKTVKIFCVMQSFLFEALLRLACLSVWNVLSHNGSILIASPKELNHICRATRTIGNHINNLSPCKQPSPQRLCQSGNLTLGNQNFQLSRFFSGVATRWLNCKFCHHLASLTTNSGGLGMFYNRHMVLYLSICMSLTRWVPRASHKYSTCMVHSKSNYIRQKFALEPYY